MPSMLTSVAFVVCQVRVVDWPWLMVFGFRKGGARGGGGGGGGGGGRRSGLLRACAQEHDRAEREYQGRPSRRRCCHFVLHLIPLFCAPALWRAICRFTAGR